MTQAEEINVIADRFYSAVLMARKLAGYKNSEAIVAAIPKGGLPIASYLSSKLHLPLELLLCKRIPHPGASNESIGSVSLNEAIINERGQQIPQEYIHNQIIRLQQALRNKYRYYCNDHEPISFRNKVVIVVDDLLKNGDTMLACLKSIKKQRPAKIIVAIAFASQARAQEIAAQSDEMIIISNINDRFALEEVQRTLPPVDDNEVRNLFAKSIKSNVTIK